MQQVQASKKLNAPVQASMAKPKGRLRPDGNGKVNVAKYLNQQWQVSDEDMDAQAVEITRQTRGIIQGNTYMKVKLADTSTAYINAQYLMGAEIEASTDDLGSDDRTFTVNLSAYYGGDADFTGHVFLGVELDDATVRWMGFVPKDGLQADRPEDMQQHVDKEYTSSIDDDSNKGHSRKTTHSKVSVSKDKRDDLISKFESEGGNTKYIWKSQDCIAIAKKVLAAAGIDALSNEIGNEKDAKNFAQTRTASYTDTVKNKDWTEIDSDDGKRMYAYYDYDKDLLLMGPAKDNFQMIHESDYMELVVQSMDQDGYKTNLIFVILGRFPAGAFQKGKTKKTKGFVQSNFKYSKVREA